MEDFNKDYSDKFVETNENIDDLNKKFESMVTSLELGVAMSSVRKF